MYILQSATNRNGEGGKINGGFVERERSIPLQTSREDREGNEREERKSACGLEGERRAIERVSLIFIFRLCRRFEDDKRNER